MSTELLETGGVTLTQFAGKCESCHPAEPQRCYQITGANGYVAMCSACLDALSSCAFDDDDTAHS